MSSGRQSVFDRFTLSQAGGGLPPATSPTSAEPFNRTEAHGKELPEVAVVPVEKMPPVPLSAKEKLKEQLDKIGSPADGFVHPDKFPTIRESHYIFMFKQLIGRSPSADEVVAGMHLARSLRLSDGDPLWPILLSYQCFDTKQRENLITLNEAVDESKTILKELSLQAASIRSDYCFIPKPLRSKSPVWLQVMLSLSTLKSTVVATSCFLALAAFIQPSSSERIAMENGGRDFFSSCFYGRGEVVNSKNGDTLCVLPSGMKGAYVLKRASK